MRKTPFFLALMMIVALAAPASAQGRVDWNGVRGADSVGTCAEGQAGYLHWILTGGKLATAGTTLTVDGDTVEGMRHGNGAGAIHFYTDYKNPADIVEAYAEFTGTANRNALLTISDGCAGEEEEPLPI